MAKFPFIVKHNGIVYPAGKEVPIGIETKKEVVLADKSATEIKKELKEKYGITKFNGNSKEALMAQLKEVEEAEKAEPSKKVEEFKEDKNEQPISEMPEGTEDDGKTFLEKVLSE